MTSRRHENTILATLALAQLDKIANDPASPPGVRAVARIAASRTRGDYPILIFGDEGIACDPPVLLREVAEDLYVGSAGSVDRLEKTTAVVQFSERCRRLQRPQSLRIPFTDFGPVPEEVLRAAAGFVEHHRSDRNRVLLQCFAGLNRSASVAYAMLRSLYGMRHDEALARVRFTTGQGRDERTWPGEATLASARAWCDAGAR